MDSNIKFYSTRTSSLKKYNHLLIPPNLKFINKPVIYHPINPIHPFKIDMLNVKELSKRKNALLINNKPLKDLILKFSLDEKKNSDENNDPNKYYFNKFKNEDKNYQLTIRALLKNDIDNFPLYLSERKEKEHKNKKKINLKINFSRNDNQLISNNNLRLYTSYSSFKTSRQNKYKLLKGFSGYIKSNSKDKKLKINKTNLKRMGIKLLKLPNTNKKKILINNENKPNIIKKHLSFSATNIQSSKLGKISIFCVLEEIGPYGKIIANNLINYLIEYFKSCKEMNVCIDKNNIYSILHWSFLNGQKYLIENNEQLKINLMNSGCMVCFLYLPKNKSNKIYCANSGINKCLLYTNRGPDILSFLLTIDRFSERDRISEFLKKKKIDKALDKIKENLKDQNNNENNNNPINNLIKEKDDKAEDEKNNDKDNKIIDTKEDNNTKNEILNIEINEEELEKDKQNCFNYFNVLGYTRCVGLLSASDFGLIPNPEINECDLKAGKVKYAVLGNYTFWKLLKEEEIRFITSKYISTRDSNRASKELDELIRQKVGTNSKLSAKCGYEIIYFDNYI